MSGPASDISSRSQAPGSEPQASPSAEGGAVAPAPAKDGSSACPPHNSNWLLQWLIEGKHNEITQHFIRVLEFLNKRGYSKPSYYVNRFVHDFLYIMGHPDYEIAPEFVPKLIDLNPVVANVVAMTPYETTDACIDLAKHGNNNVRKICVLYSPRNRMKIDRKRIVDANPALASLWYTAYMSNYPIIPADPDGLQRLREHIDFSDDRLDLSLGEPTVVYYGATYVDHENDKHVKRRINEAFQRKHAAIPIRHKPRTTALPKIAVVSDLWRQNHSACRIQYRFIESLKGHYHLTLLHALYRNEAMFDKSLFDEVIYIGNGRGRADITPIQENDFDIAYFSDVGMTTVSISLANLRIAPIQILGPGHPVSSWGAELDYFISGTENELPQDAQSTYSEKLLLLPGMGAIHNPIKHPRQNRSPSTEPLIINCPWSPQKTNCDLLKLLAQVVQRTQTKLLFRFFPASFAVRHCGAIPFRRSLEAVLGVGRVDIQHSLKYANYMDLLEEGAFTLDSYPYGGGNVIADSLYMRRPVVCLEGRHWYNRMGPAMLRRLGLDELVASTPEEFVDKICSLVNDPASRSRCSAALNDENLNTHIFCHDIAPHFKSLIDKILSEKRKS